MIHHKSRIVVLFVLALLLCACSGSKKRYVIGVSQCSEDIWRDKLNDELRMGAYSYDNVELRFASADDNDDKQIEQIDRFISDGIDLLIVSPNQVATITPAIDRAYDKGIPVIVFDRKTSSKKYTAYIGADNKLMGRELGEYIAHRLNGHGNVVEIMGLKGSSPAIERHTGFVEALSRYPGIRLLASLQGDWTEQSGQKAMENYLKSLSANTQHSSAAHHIDFVFGQNDRMAIGASKALKQSISTPSPSINTQHPSPTTLFCGIDALPTAGGGIECVRDNILEASYIYPTHGDEVMQLAMNILQGKPYDKENLLKAAIVTKENARVLLMQNEETIRQTGYVNQLHKQANEYLRQLGYQRLLTLSAVGIVALLLLMAVVTYLYLRQKTKINRERAQMARQQLDFYTQASHELRTPLTLIEGPLAQLAATNDMQNASEKAVEMLDIVQRNTAQLSKLVNKILDVQVDNSWKNDASAQKIEGGGWQNSTVETSLDVPTPAAGGDGKTDHSVLIVDDNDDIRAYLRTILQANYTIFEAADGQQGLDIAHKEVPDLIVSDVMMPVMNGLEFCQRVKDDFVTSHIPVILLTARALSQHQVEGYRSGADGYITKPFQPDVLLARIDNLLRSRVKLKNLFTTTITTTEKTDASTPEPTDIVQQEHEFITRFREQVERDMANSDLNVESIGQEMGLSRVQLYRKVKALTGMSPVELIRKTRLMKAHELLQTTDKTVSEVAYEVGFSAPSYFTKCFKDEYGMLPGDVKS